MNKSYPPKAPSVKIQTLVQTWIIALLNALKYVSIRTIPTLFIWLLWGVALGLPTGLWLIQLSVEEVVSSYRGDTGYTVYFEPGTGQTEIDTVVAHVRSYDFVRQVELKTADQALDEFRQRRGPNFDRELALLKTNPFPASLHIFIEQSNGSANADELTQWLRQQRIVDDLSTHWGWMSQLSSTRLLIKWLTWVIGFAILLGSGCIAVLTIRVSTSYRPDEIYSLWLLGVPKRLIRRPYVLRAFFYGFGGGFAALSLLAVAVFVLSDPLDRFVRSQDVLIEFVQPNLLLGTIVIGIGVVLSCLGTSLTTTLRIRRIVRQSTQF